MQHKLPFTPCNAYSHFRPELALPRKKKGDPKAAIKDTAKTACAIYGLTDRIRLTNQVQLRSAL